LGAGQLQPEPAGTGLMMVAPVAPPGTASVMLTDVATDGPLFFTCKRYVYVLPPMAIDGPDLDMTKSAMVDISVVLVMLVLLAGYGSPLSGVVTVAVLMTHWQAGI